MVNNKVVVTRVTRNQFERIKVNAQAKGYKTISDYLRSLALDKDIIFDKKFNELYDKIINNKETDNENNNKNNKYLTDYI